MRLKTVVFLLASVFISESCRDVLFNNPLDPDASREVLQVIKSIETPFSGEGDIAHDGEKFWKIGSNGELVAFDVETGILIRSLSGISGTGVAFTNNRLYTCDETNVLRSYDPLSGDLIDQIALADVDAWAITADNGNLLIYDGHSNQVLRFNPIDSSREILFGLSGLAIKGIDIFGGMLVVTDANTNNVYRFILDGTVEASYLSPVPDTRGITSINDEYLFLLTIDGQLVKVALP